VRVVSQDEYDEWVAEQRAAQNGGAGDEGDDLTTGGSGS
jgi:heme/copper-type cytochrome/quinol oxidase subunit 2